MAYSSGTVLITRPEPSASAFAAALRSTAGWDVPVMIAPMLRIEPTGSLPGFDNDTCLIFTSANGVAAYRAAGGVGGQRAVVVGPSTAEAARNAGINVELVARDAADLLSKVETWTTHLQFLHLRGEVARGEIAVNLRSRGIQCIEQVIYRQILLPLPFEAARLLGGEKPVVVPLFSPRSASHFSSEWRGPAPVLGAMLSSAVDYAARSIPWRKIEVAATPDRTGMVDATLRLLNAAQSLEGGQARG